MNEHLMMKLATERQKQYIAEAQLAVTLRAIKLQQKRAPKQNAL